jgi:rhamnogalacturonan endolyase
MEHQGHIVLAVLEGMSGAVLRTTPWPAMLTDFAKSSTRIAMSIAYLDGKHPAIVTQTGLYENERYFAYDAHLKELWHHDSVAETNGSGGHWIEVADVDGDGKDEIFGGTMCLSGNGKLRWALYRGHADVVAPRDFIPERPGLEVFFAVETSLHAGAYLADGLQGKVIWKANRQTDPNFVHAHIGWAADVVPTSPGIEVFTNRDGHPAKETVLFSTDGRILLEGLDRKYRPVEWDGDEGRELLSMEDELTVGKLEGKKVRITATLPKVDGRAVRPVAVADLWGDYRDEIVAVTGGGHGGGADGDGARGATQVIVFTANSPITHRRVTPTASRQYRTWLAHNMIGGYPSYFEAPPESLSKP